MLDRIGRLKKKMAGDGLDAMIIAEPRNLRYISGFTGSAGYVIILLKTNGDKFLLADPRYSEQAEREAPGFEVIQYERDPENAIADILNSHALATVGFEKDALTYSEYERLSGKWKSAGFTLKPVEDLVGQLRAVKEEEEIRAIRRAAALADQAFSAWLPTVRPGLEERELANELEYIMRKLGADFAAFPTIVASGARSSMPHASASRSRLARGDLLLIDFGATVDGYNSDMTRTLSLGPWGAEQRRAYSAVLEAQSLALREIAPERGAKEIDAAARDLIARRGFRDRFGHGLGHGVGLAVHEFPRLSPQSDDLLEPGMVVTVEPGIYLPGRFGVRVEDMVLVTSTGYELLTGTTREMISI